MKILANWTPTPDELAQAFCEMHTDEQAKFFVGVADYADDWPGAIAPISQWHAVGRHLAREIAARSVLNAIVDAADECCRAVVRAARPMSTPGIATRKPADARRRRWPRRRREWRIRTA